MTPYDAKSHELHEIKEAEEERLHRELGRCPGPTDLLASASIDRRGFLKVGTGGLLSLMFAQWLDPRRAAADPTAQNAKQAKACILLWMNGGPSHVDTWDPKTGNGAFKSIKTRASGIEICEHLPNVADVADHLAIVRGMTSKEGNHQRAQYLMHTGYSPNPTVQHPSLGGWVSEEMGDPRSDLPSFVSISGPSIGAGFLGVQYGPLVVQTPGTPPQNIALGPNVNVGRFGQRQSALSMLESQFGAETGDSKVKGRQDVYAKAVRLMQSPRLKAFSTG